jgi:SAP domain
MFELSRFAKTIGEEVREGKLSLQFGFSSFQQQVRQIPPGTDFSRLAIDHMNNKPQQDEAKRVDRGADTVSNSTQQAAPRAPAAGVAIDLCSDNEKDDGSSWAEKQVRVVGSCRMERAVPSPHDSAVSSTSNTRAVRPQSRFNPSKEVLSYFGTDESTDEDEDEDIQSAQALLKRCRKSEKRQKRKKAEAEEAANKKRKSVGLNAYASARKRKAPHKTTPAPDINTVSQTRNESQSGDEYDNLSVAQLQAKCSEVGLAKGGSKENLIERLRGPKPPQVWLDRKSKGEYVPARYNTGASALLVALYLHERQADENALGLTKPELYEKVSQSR